MESMSILYTFSATRSAASLLSRPARGSQVLNRKVLIGKLTHPAAERRKKKRGPRPATYSREVQAALIQVWESYSLL